MPRRLPLVALVLLISGPGLLAQHGGSTGSISSGHFGGGGHVGPSPSFSAPAHGYAPPLAARSPSLQANQSRRWPYPPHHPGDGRNGVGYRRGYPYVYAGYPWLSFGYGLPLGYGVPYAGDQDEASAPQPAPEPDQPVADYGPEPPGPEVAANISPFRPPYQGTVEAAPVYDQPATTLIFKDGRPPAQVHNYSLTATTLYAFDGESRQEISLSQLNLPATVEANRAAGVDFALPVNR
jgi:hypothetical protein